jgi:hypothetical protein
MTVFRLAQSDGLHLKRVSSAHQGEYHGPCPGCGGRDRFSIQIAEDRYFCRQCKRRGDAIQYYRDFHGMTYGQACEALCIEPKKRSRSTHHMASPSFVPRVVQLPCDIWRVMAQQFVDVSHRQLLQTPYALQQLQKRGFTPEGIAKFQFGWNPTTLWFSRSEWGLQEDDGKKLWVPSGLVIPVFDPVDGKLIKLKIRRHDWKEGDEFPKYVEVSGSIQSPSVFLSPSMQSIVLIMEAEFDAMLIHQLASDLCFSIALGGASKRPDASCHQLLQKASRILLALDVDQAGATAFRWWKANYPDLRLWLPPVGKSPGDAWAEGIDLRHWIVEGICESG